LVLTFDKKENASLIMGSVLLGARKRFQG